MASIKLSEQHMEEASSQADQKSQGHDSISCISPEHERYLLQRHGTLDLDPLPQPDDADPYNWPYRKKIINLILVIFHASMATFNAAAIVPAFQQIADDFKSSLQTISYLTTVQIVFLAFGPLIWKPFANTYGRRPLFLLSLIGSLVSNVGCARSSSYGTMCFCRALVGLFMSLVAAIGSVVVTEMFFKKNRAFYIGLWTLMVTIGVPSAPLIMGFVSARVKYRWIYWILAITNGIQLVTYFFFGPETRYIPNGATVKASARKSYLQFRRIDPSPLTVQTFIHPLTLSRKVCVSLAGLAHAVTFMFGNTLIVVELPELFGDKFGFNSEKLGLQFIGLIVGSIIGEQIGGGFSDYWMRRKSRNSGTEPPPEYRLWISYLGFSLSLIGLVMFLVQTDRAPRGHWNISPVIGIAIAGAGNQIITTVLITYAIDCHPEESASIGVLITLIRQALAFLGPFWFTSMFNNVGIAPCSGIVCGLIVALSISPVAFLHCRGSGLRASKNENTISRDIGSV
ncbi:MFS general substrate transporter [Penicillium angulare]|uniref:MFS general substrate transporter n=1 Tax=Penicillium angulare TaxID=116970 RepID=A0A9W9KCW5_9EURO|nr:MFS general substrate transporter [Penicillium angulare]